MSTASILAAASQTSVTVFGAITSSATLVSSSVNAAAALAQTLEAQATGFRDRTVKDIASANKKLDLTTESRAMLKVARVMRDMQRELNLDPELAAMLALVQDEWDKPDPKFALTLVAA